MLVVCQWCWRSCSMKELSICICISISNCICFTFCNWMGIWMRWSKSECGSMNIMMSNNMRINRTSYHMVHHSTVSLCGNMSVSTMLSNNILALLYIGGVHHSVVLGGALLLLVALLLCFLLHHCVALRHCVCSTLLFMFSNIVCNMFCVTHSLWHSMALLGCHHFIGQMTPWSIVTISISTMSTMAIVMTIAWVTFCCGFCFSRAERNIEEAKKNYNLFDHDVV